MSGAQFSFTLEGDVGQTYEVQGTTDLLSWQTVTNIRCTVSPTPSAIVDQAMPHRFYRVVRP
jgi:hypothetical protein